MQTQNKSIIQYVSCLIIILLVITVSYLLINGGNSNLIDTQHYDMKIGTLNNKIDYNEAKLDSIEKTIEIYLTKIEEYDLELINLKYKLENYKKQYEKDINRINSLSNGDLEREFTNTF
jgi:peptidoglycan hydrolase CwlO-like protein